MYIPLVGRIGILIILGGFAIDFALWLRPEDAGAGPFWWGPFSTVLLPAGIFLLLISVIGLTKKTSSKADNNLTLSKSQSEGLKPRPVSPASTLHQPGRFMSVFASPLVLLAIALIFLGVVFYTGSYYWMTTRTFVPLEMPVSLSRGHIRTGNFYINLKERYEVDLAVDYPFYENPSCQLNAPNSVLKTNLVVFRNGQVLNETNGSDYYSLGSFFAEKRGSYNLDIEVLSDASCLNARHPQVMVETSWYAYDSYTTRYKIIHWFGLVLVAAGLIGLNRSDIGLLAREMLPADKFVILEGPHSGSYKPRRELAVNKLISAIPSFGLLFAIVLLLISCWVFFMDTILHTSPTGFWVSVPGQSPAATAQVPLEGKIVFRIDAQNHWYLNSKEISPAELPGALKKALAQRPDWVVYFEASRQIDYKDAVSAMNAIRNAHAQIVLITPRMKADTP